MKVGGRIGETHYTIEDLWIAIKERFRLDPVLAAIEFYEGHQHLNLELTTARVVFVQAQAEIAFGAAWASAGGIGMLTDACEAHIWAVAETPAEDYRQDQVIPAKAIAIEMMTAASLSYSGHVQGGTIDVASDTHVLKYGEMLVLSIKLLCPIYKVKTSTALHVGGARNSSNGG